MIPRALIVALVLPALLSSPLPAHAAQRLVIQKYAPRSRGVYLSVRLKPGRQYRVDIGSPKHEPFSGMGGEYYTYVRNQQLLVATKPFQVQGTTPKSFTVQQKISGTVQGWILYIQVQVMRGVGVVLRVYDVGKRSVH